MLVYRDIVREVSGRELLQRARRLATGTDALHFLVEAGELEQAVLDTLDPDHDAWHPTAATLRALSLAAARAFLSTGGTLGDTDPRATLRLLDNLEATGVPATVRLKPPEGYVHYGLDPAAYAASAAAYSADVGDNVARRAVVVGVRSIGTSLSAVVAAVCGADRTITLRPRGPSGSRTIRAAESWLTRIRALLDGAGDVLIVDEGPGATGETFECVHTWFRRLGVPASRIVLFTSAAGGMALAPGARKAWFARARKYVVPLHDPRPGRIVSDLGLDEPVDLGAGRWRRVVPGSGELPACTGFERTKFLARDRRGATWQVRYAGVGRWLEELLERGRLLAAAGLAAPPWAVGSGFVVVSWIDGVPLNRSDTYDPRVVAAVSEYVATRAGLLRTGSPVDVQLLCDALRVNGRAAGVEAGLLDRAVQRLEHLPIREAVIPDARMRPFEWVRSKDGIVKVDALEHGDGLKMPGPTDPCWDIAGAVVEFEIGGAALASLIRRCAAALAESRERLAETVDALIPVYAACAFGEADLAAQEAPCEIDRGHLAAEARYYAARLAESIDGRLTTAR